MKCLKRENFLSKLEFCNIIIRRVLLEVLEALSLYFSLLILRHSNNFVWQPLLKFFCTICNFSLHLVCVIMFNIVPTMLQERWSRWGRGLGIKQTWWSTSFVKMFPSTPSFFCGGWGIFLLVWNLSTARFWIINTEIMRVSIIKK